MSFDEIRSPRIQQMISENYAQRSPGIQSALNELNTRLSDHVFSNSTIGYPVEQTITADEIRSNNAHELFHRSGFSRVEGISSGEITADQISVSNPLQSPYTLALDNLIADIEFETDENGNDMTYLVYADGRRVLKTPVPIFSNSRTEIELMKDQIQSLKDEIENLKMLLLDN